MMDVIAIDNSSLSPSVEERRNTFNKAKVTRQEDSERTLETCPDLSEHSLEDSADYNVFIPKDSLLGDEYEEVTVSDVDLIEYEERSLDSEDELSDDDEDNEDSEKDKEWISSSSCEQYGYGDAAPDVATKLTVSQCERFEASPHRRSSADCIPRRSSMKQGLGRRRASMCTGDEFDVNLPGRKNPVRRKSSICFCAEVDVAEVVPVTELTDNVEDLWLQSKDYDRIIEKSYDLVDLASQGMKYCVRGLENFVEDNQQSKFEYWDAVLDEQEKQRGEGKFNDEAMARACKLSSVESKMEAGMRAKKDQKDVEKYLRETRDFCRRLSM